MSNETEEIEAIFEDIRQLSDELGLETTLYVDMAVDEEMLSGVLGATTPRAGVRRRVVGGLATLAVAASVATALAVGNGGSDRPDPDALSASLPAPSFGPDIANELKLERGKSAAAMKVAPDGLSGGLIGSLDELAFFSGHILLVEGDVVVRTIAGPDRTGRKVTLLGEPALELRPGLGYTGRLIYFAFGRSADTYEPIVPPYAETSPGVFVATAPTGDQVLRFTADQLAEAMKRR